MKASWNKAGILLPLVVWTVGLQAQMDTPPETVPAPEASAVVEEPASPEPAVTEPEPAPAPEAPPAPAPEPAPPPSSPPPENQPVPSSQEPTAPAPAAKPAPIPKAVPVPRNSMGLTQGDFWIGQRSIVDRYVGWGWIRRPDQGWRSAKWVMLMEKPGQAVAPHRFMESSSADENVQYKLYGALADFKGYEPNYDAFVDVFILEGFEKIGPGTPLKRQPPRSANGGNRGSNAFPGR